ncbi:MAG: ricin-type beta-trefoil lectin domain protein [Acidobacteria bacterium]|nr:ricin-type beta-trefoil lectin domain protein [Acidobacteriota bacterium]
MHCAVLLLLFLASVSGAAVSALGAPPGGAKLLAATPPMGWNDWAHYQCGYTAQTILENARELVKTGLAARGYNTVTIDDCWMQKDRDASGNLQANPQRFPQGMKPVAQAIHALGLKFGIYEDAGYATCDKLAGSGQPKGGGPYHFLQDARLFASWGVDYLKLDGCNVYVPPGSTREAAYRRAYAAENEALKSVGRPVVFSESAPAYFQGTPEWYDVLTWVRYYGQLWREGSDMANYHANDPDAPRFPSVLWNYAYNLPLARFQKPGNWNDADFIIGGDSGMSLSESRSQLALWSMMSAPLILSSDIAKLSPAAIAILGNKAVIAIDQDPLGRMATLVRRSPDTDVLFKRLANGDDAVAVLNHGEAPVQVDLYPTDFGFAANPACRLDAQNLWNGARESALSALAAEVAPHDTAIWRIHASADCGRPARTGTITLTNNVQHRATTIASYTRCLAAPGQVEACAGTAAEKWTVTPSGELLSSDNRCLSVANGKPAIEACRSISAQRWRYTLRGNLINGASHQCLSAAWPQSDSQSLQVQPCGHNQPNQIWSLPN